MSSFADLPEVVGFFSYSREDDESFEGMLSALRDGIHRELSAQLGRSKTNFRVWQDQQAIAPGKLWESEIKNAVEQAVFFIPIVTPRAINSHYCRLEFEAFLAREQALGRTDLVFPILYIGVPALEDDAQWRKDLVLSVIGTRQYVDWRSLRHLDVRTTAFREAIERFCNKIVETLRKPWISPEERRKQQEQEDQRRLAEAARQAAEEEQRAEAARKRRSDWTQQKKTIATIAVIFAVIGFSGGIIYNYYGAHIKPGILPETTPQAELKHSTPTAAHDPNTATPAPPTPEQSTPAAAHDPDTTAPAPPTPEQSTPTASHDPNTATPAPPTPEQSTPIAAHDPNTVTPSPAAYAQGVAAYDSLQSWFNAQSGDRRAGAEYWAASRNLRKHASCASAAENFTGDRQLFAAGCRDAKDRLDPIDAQRADPHYRAGFNDEANRAPMETDFSRRPDDGTSSSATQQTTPYSRGVADADALQSWFHVQAGDRRAGAEYWAANRNVHEHASCTSAAENFTGDRQLFAAGCRDATDRLDPIDARRADPQYRAGFKDEASRAPMETGFSRPDDSTSSSGAQEATPYSRGVADADVLQSWFNAQNGDRRAGAEYWAANRNVREHASCTSAAENFTGDRQLFAAGCRDAKDRLDPIDARRADPQYRAGFNDEAARPPR